MCDLCDIENQPPEPDYKYLMIITCKETDENIHELYGNDKAALQREFENEYGELYCKYEIFENNGE